MNTSMFDFYKEGVRCGLMRLWNSVKSSIKEKKIDRYGIYKSVFMIIRPVDLTRYLEFPFVANRIKGIEGSTVLDIGSLKLLAFCVARKKKCNVIATDIVSKVQREVNWFKGCDRVDNLHWRVEDATCLSFGDSTVEEIFSVSVLEHIGKDGDIKAVKEFARVLKPRGKVYITVRFVPNFYQAWIDSDPMGCQVVRDDGKVFFSRYYDLGNLYMRLIDPSGLTLIELTA